MLDNLQKSNYEKIKSIINEESQGQNFMQEWVEEHILFEDISDEDRALFEGMKSEYHFGGEDQGSTYWTVWNFPAAQLKIRFNGWYQSYEGADYQDMELVELQEVKRMEYVTAK